MNRFVSEDPTGLAGGDPNFYAYAFDNPTNLTDPTGCRTKGILAALPKPTAGKKPTKTVPPIIRERLKRLSECLYTRLSIDCAEGVERCWDFAQQLPVWDQQFLLGCIAVKCGIRPRTRHVLRECWDYAKQVARNG
jgi:hypothetical protein